MSLAKTRFRQALFLHSISDIPTASECYCPMGSDIVRLRLSVIFYSPFKLAQRNFAFGEIFTRRKPNITAKQYNSPKANRTGEMLRLEYLPMGALFSTLL